MNLMHFIKRRRRGILPLVASMGIAVLAAGCGTATSGGPHSSQAATPPSRATLQKLFASHHTVVKTATLTFKGQSPEDIVVTTTPPKSSTSVLAGLKVSVVAWKSATAQWKIIWQSRLLNLQQGLEPGHPVVPSISSWKIQKTSQGALVGLLNPASLGADTEWNDGVLLWVPPGGTPKTLWTATGNHTVADGTLATTSKGIRVNQYACSAVEAEQVGGRPRLTQLSCTDILAEAIGQRLRFTTLRNGQVQPAHSTLTVTRGRSLVFWPTNATARNLVNAGQLGLYGGYFGSSFPAGTVPLAAADSITHWTYHFTKAGTYHFAIVPNATTSPMVTASITVHVTG